VNSVRFRSCPATVTSIFAWEPDPLNDEVIPEEEIMRVKILYKIKLSVK